MSIISKKLALAVLTATSVGLGNLPLAIPAYAQDVHNNQSDQSVQLRGPNSQSTQAESESKNSTDAVPATIAPPATTAPANVFPPNKNLIPPPVPTGATPIKIETRLEGSASMPAEPGPSGATDNSTVNESISIARPSLKALISVNDYLSPFGLDSTSSNRVDLRNVLLSGIDRNLDLAISRTNSKVQQWTYYNSLGKFLPDYVSSFDQYFTKGMIAFPFNAFSAGNSSQAGPSRAIKVDTPFMIETAGFKYYGYRGGKILFGALQAKHNYRAAQQGAEASLRDTLLTLTKNFYNLVLAEELLQIRIQAVRTSEEQLRNNSNLFKNGLATNLDVLQSKTQLSRDRQALVDQQINRRNAAITLADSMNIDLGTDLGPTEPMVRKVRLIDPRMTVGDLLSIAIDNRPELKQYEQLRLAAKRNIVVQQANLHPQMFFAGNIYGIGPPRTVEALYTMQVGLNWNVGGFGANEITNVQTARWQARQAQLQQQKELLTVLQQSRSSLLQSLDTEHNIQEASNEVASSVEELRLAQLRFKSGLGTNLDIITAQRDYTQALIDKATAIINYNIAQAQLLHDVGMISVDSLSGGRLLAK